MADAKISQLTALTTAADDDLLAIVDTSATETKKIAKSDLVAGLQAELVSGTNIKTINSTSLLGSGDISISASPAGTAGQIQFSDGSAFAADSNLFWDNTNKRLGVGTSSPGAKIDAYVSGTGTGDFLLGKFKYQTGGASRNVFLKLGAGTSLFDINVNADNPYYEIRYGNNDATLGAGLAQRVLYNGQTAIPNSTVIGDSVIQSTARLLVKGSGSTSATTSLLVQNSSGVTGLTVFDNGNVSVGSSTNSGYQLFGNGSWFNNGSIFSPQYYFTSISPGAGGSTNLYGNINNFKIGTSATATASAVFEVDSTTKGFLPPRMTTTQKNAISTPALGLQVVDTTTSRPCVYTTAWESLTSSDSASPTAVYKFWSGTAAQYAALTPDANTVYFVS